MPFLNLLLIIILALIAHRTKRFITAGIVYGALKAIAVYFQDLAESNLSFNEVALIASVQYVINALLGMAVGYLVAEHSNKPALGIVTTTLFILTFVTTAVNPFFLN